MRYVICHYHIYKNSGTTFDRLLSDNYENKHLCFDGPFPFFIIDQNELSRIIERKNNVVAFSSHQIRLPVPASLDFTVLPVVFIRHPILRVQSIYKFKRKAYDGTKTSKAAMEKTFDEWITACFADRQEMTHISNSQAAMLGATYQKKSLVRKEGCSLKYDVHQAVRNIQNVKLLARTEYFNADVKRFTGILAEYNIEFMYKDIRPQNTTSSDHCKPIEERLEQVEQLLSVENHKKLLDANAQDIYLYDHITKLIEKTP